MILIYTVCKTKTEAKKIAKMLLKLKLVACANFWQAESVYTRKDKLVEDKEVILVLKTRKNYYQKIAKFIKEVHSYKTPCILKLDPSKVDQDYLAWLRKQTKLI